MSISSYIVDDEFNNIETLSLLLSHIDDVEVKGTFQSPTEAFNQILKATPELLFLDVQMPEMSGFELLERLPDLPMCIIFVTAHSDFAIKAFKVNAVDYILKPVLFSDLKLAVDKVRERIAQKKSATQKTLFSDKISLPTSKGIEFVNITDIVRLHGSGSYTELYMDQGQKLMVSKNLGDFEELLVPAGFIRVHTSHMINPQYLVRYLKEDGGTLIMRDQAQIPVSRRKKDDFLNMIKG